ncbi:MAG: MFS transporter [Flammeovirgaceae bacterium]|jgi:maltose/moltooligosaccharide transporter|nr:MFS transporter [Flammeovirgaceae bacterium]
MTSPSLGKPKPQLSFWQIWNMSFGFLGIQFGFALQNANTSRIFETLGAEPSSLALFWAAAPITGLIVQPIVGFYSDRTWHPKWGRRRPYFAIGAILATMALCIMPNSPSLWFAVGMLWIMDASINISMEPFRAFVGDMLPPLQRTTGFAMQSFFIGIGGVVASCLPYIFSHWLGISNTALVEGEMPDSVKYSFYLGAATLFITVMWTVFTTKEYPPEPHHQNLKNREKRKIENEEESKSRIQKVGMFLLSIGIVIIWLVNYLGNKYKELYLLGGGLVFFGVIHLLTVLYIRQGRSYLGLVHMVRDLNYMPKTMVDLAYVQFFSWFALFSMWIYTTPAVTSYIYNTNEPTSTAYNDGADWVSVLFGMYSGVAALAALFLPILAKYSSRRVAHFISLLCGGLGLISIFFIREPNFLIFSMIGIGIGWASILSIPYAMLSGSLPPEKMGYYMGVFNFFIVIPQIIAATVLGFILEAVFGGQSIYILVFGGVCMIIASLLSLRVRSSEEVVV